MIKIESGKDAVIVKFPYNPDYIAKIKSVKGYRWHPNEKYWSVPYSELKNLLSAFDGEKVEVDLSVWFYELGKELIARKYSRRTVKLYLHYNEEFLKFWNKTPYQVSNEDVIDYLYYLAERKLRVEDVDVERRLIRIRGKKGRKDRYMILSEVALNTFREYIEKYKPKKWLFPGRERTGT